MKNHLKYIVPVTVVVVALIIGVLLFINSGKNQLVGTLVNKPLPCDTVPATCGDAVYFVVDGGEFFLVKDPVPADSNLNKNVRVDGTTEERDPKPCFGGEECVTKFISISKVTVVE